MDWRALLIKYMRLCIRTDGVVHLPFWDDEEPEFNDYHIAVGVTEEQHRLLEACASEAQALENPPEVPDAPAEPKKEYGPNGYPSRR